MSYVLNNSTSTVFIIIIFHSYKKKLFCSFPLFYIDWKTLPYNNTQHHKNNFFLISTYYILLLNFTTPPTLQTTSFYSLEYKVFKTIFLVYTTQNLFGFLSNDMCMYIKIPMTISVFSYHNMQCFFCLKSEILFILFQCTKFDVKQP